MFKAHAAQYLIAVVDAIAQLEKLLLVGGGQEQVAESELGAGFDTTAKETRRRPDCRRQPSYRSSLVSRGWSGLRCRARWHAARDGILDLALGELEAVGQPLNKPATVSLSRTSSLSTGRWQFHRRTRTG